MASVHFSTQTQFNNFIQRTGALKTQVGHAWLQAREAGADNTETLRMQFKYLQIAIRDLCGFVVGATDNLLTDAEVDTAYEQIILIGNLCDSAYLLNDTL